jgi:hypothetical protein
LGTQAHCAWLQDYPDGFRALLNYIYKRYKKEIYVTENGFAVKNEDSMPLAEALKDKDRVNYFRGATDAVLKAINEDGVDIRSYFPWSFLDNFEWADGYITRFGVTYVDYNNQKRYPKDSAYFLSQWFSEHLQSDEAHIPAVRSVNTEIDSDDSISLLDDDRSTPALSRSSPATTPGTPDKYSLPTPPDAVIAIDDPKRPSKAAQLGAIPTMNLEPRRATEKQRSVNIVGAEEQEPSRLSRLITPLLVVFAVGLFAFSQ